MAEIKNEIKIVKISELKENPKNPRFIKDDKFKKLCQSIKDFPEMLSIRPIIVDENNTVLGGNMRLKACLDLKLKEVPVIFVNSLSEAQKAQFIIKDNVGFGEWDWDILQNEWDSVKLDEWGLDVPKFDSEETEVVQPENENQYFLNIRCKDEVECQEMYEKFILQGLDVKIVT